MHMQITLMRSWAALGNPWQRAKFLGVALGAGIAAPVEKQPLKLQHKAADRAADSDPLTQVRLFTFRVPLLPLSRLLRLTGGGLPLYIFLSTIRLYDSIHFSEMKAFTYPGYPRVC